jgi:hypothetical protein
LGLGNRHQSGIVDSLDKAVTERVQYGAKSADILRRRRVLLSLCADGAIVDKWSAADRIGAVIDRNGRTKAPLALRCPTRTSIIWLDPPLTGFAWQLAQDESLNTGPMPSLMSSAVSNRWQKCLRLAQRSHWSRFENRGCPGRTE